MELIVGRSGARGFLYLSKSVSADACDVNAMIDVLFAKCANSLRAALGKLLECCYDGEIYKTYFDLQEFSDGETVRITRAIKLIRGRETVISRELESSFTVFDHKTLKQSKNSKKQRFIPSRNNKNVKNKERKPTD